MKAMEKRGKRLKIFFFYFFIPIFLCSLSLGGALPQPVSEEKEPQIRLGEVSFLSREIESTPSNLNILEVHVEVLNQSQKLAAPPDSIKVVITPEEVKFSGAASSGGFTLSPEEIILNLPLSPMSGRVMMIGFPVPKEKLESITFEIQVNPPEGEKKRATFTF